MRRGNFTWKGQFRGATWSWLKAWVAVSDLIGARCVQVQPLHLDKSQDAICEAFKVDRDETGNLPPLPAIFPDQMAPIVRIADDERTLSMMRWGFPPPPKAVPQPVTNMRNAASPYWWPWLKPEQRCLVPVSLFSEYADT